MFNLPKDYIRMCWKPLADMFKIYRSCLTSRMLFDFININKDSRLVNSNLLHRSKVSVRTTKFDSQEDSTFQNKLTFN